MRPTLYLIVLFVVAIPQIATAHLATFGSWETTERYLKTLRPTATEFRVKNDTYTDEEVRALEAKLGFKLYPEDRTPAFYLALEGKRLVGVAIFIDPRLEGAETDYVRLEVGIAVDRKGRIASVKLFEYRGDARLNAPEFLNQFVGMRLNSNFDIATNPSLQPVKEMSAESQLVANAAHEALLLISTSLGKK